MTAKKIIEEQILIDGKALEGTLQPSVSEAVTLLNYTKLRAEKLGYHRITMKYSSGEFFNEESRPTLVFYGRREETDQEHNTRVLKEAIIKSNLGIPKANKEKLARLEQEIAELKSRMKESCDAG